MHLSHDDRIQTLTKLIGCLRRHDRDKTQKNEEKFCAESILQVIFLHRCLYYHQRPLIQRLTLQASQVALGQAHQP